MEYRQRGSPQIHILVWIKNSPEFGKDSDGVVTSFIDNITSCEKPGNNPELSELVNRQIHWHSHTFRKKSKNEYRFNYPQPPVRQTVIMYPFDDEEIPQNELKAYKESWENLRSYLNDLKEGKDITFDELLAELYLTEESYLLAIRSSINTPTVFLKGKPDEIRINNYNSACLSACRANMDILFVLDVYAFVVYIANYISKAQKGMSELLRQACAEAQKSNSSIKQQVRDIGSKFLNIGEISAQEAVYLIFQIPMGKASWKIVFTNTAPPNERIQLLKPLSDLNEMDDDCEDLYTGGLLKRYTKRPATLKHLILAGRAAWYDKTKSYVSPSAKLDGDHLLMENSTLDLNDDEEHCQNKTP